MNAFCPRCERTYDDMYRSTLCPHLQFKMHMIMGRKEEAYVVTTIADMEAVHDHWKGTDTPTFLAFKDVEHKHRLGGKCMSHGFSGMLVTVE